MKTIQFSVNVFLVVALAATLVSGLAFLLSQQVLRLSANDPQIQMAEDAAATLARGDAPGIFQTTATTQHNSDMSTTLAPFLIHYDEKGQPLESTVELNGRVPVPPSGVFAYTREHGEDRITWQPQAGVRQAAVMVYFAGKQPGFILAGRSLRETEDRTTGLRQLVTVGWGGTIAALLITTITIGFLTGKVERSKPVVD